VKVFVAAILALLLAAACGGTRPAANGRPEPETLPPSPAGNFILYVSNQSFELERVDIRVTIDGRLAVDGDFAVENQHNWVEFRFRLAPGRHVLHAESARGGATLTRAFTVAGRHWAVVNYWYYPGEVKRFTFEISDRPLAFA
jgi:hypothetical protein